MNGLAMLRRAQSRRGFRWERRQIEAVTWWCSPARRACLSLFTRLRRPSFFRRRGGVGRVELGSRLLRVLLFYDYFLGWGSRMIRYNFLEAWQSETAVGFIG